MWGQKSILFKFMAREIIILVLGILLVGFAFVDVSETIDVGLTLAIGIVLVILSVVKLIASKKEKTAQEITQIPQ